MAKRPNILKLATKISLESMTYMGITYDDPEYKILEPIIDDDMCAIMMHVRLETNRTVEEVAKRARKSVEFTQEQLDKLCKTGAVRYRYVDGKRCYFYPIWVPCSARASRRTPAAVRKCSRRCSTPARPVCSSCASCPS